MKRIIFALFVFNIYCCAEANDVAFSHGSSASSISNKYKMSYGINRRNKVSVSVRSSQDLTGASDDKSSTVKINYRYKTKKGTYYSFDFKKLDESDFYQGNAISGKVSTAFFKKSKINFAVERAEKKYTKISSESFTQISYSVGIDRDFFNFLSIGVDYNFNTFSSNGENTKKALANQSIDLVDVSNHVGYLSDHSASIYLEYMGDIVTLGLSYLQDTSLIGSSQSNTTEIYGDLNVWDDWTFSVSFTRGKTEGSSSVSDSSSFGLSYRF